MSAVDPAHATVEFRDPPVNRPEASLFGVMYAGNSSYVGKPAMVNDPNIWIFNGTSLQAGDSVGLNIVGYEWDDIFPVSPSGTRALLQTNISAFGQPSRSIASYYEKSPDYGFAAGRGGKVFAAGTVQWSWGLDDIANAHSDPNMQQITLNVVRNLSAPRLSSRDDAVLFRADARALHLSNSDALSLVGGNPVLGFAAGVAMRDDGVGADSVAGDGIYSALVTLPAGTPSPVPYGYRVNGVMATLPVSSGLFWVDETVDAGDFQVQPVDRIATPALVATPPPARPLVGLALEAARPNPFRTSASLHFTIPGRLPPGGSGGDDGESPRARIAPIPSASSAGAGIRARLRIYDASGREIRTLLDGYMLPGPGSVQWDGRSAAGTVVGNGLYFARLEVGSQSIAVKLLRVR
jgi:hypothetical protein